MSEYHDLAKKILRSYSAILAPREHAIASIVQAARLVCEHCRDSENFMFIDNMEEKLDEYEAAFKPKDDQIN